MNPLTLVLASLAALALLFTIKSLASNSQKRSLSAAVGAALTLSLVALAYYVAYLADTFEERQFQRVGGVEITVRVDPAPATGTDPIQPLTESSLEIIEEVLRRRFNSSLELDAHIIRQDPTHLLVQVPAVNVAEANSKFRRLIEQIGLIEFRMVKPETGNVAPGSPADPGWNVLPYVADPGGPNHGQALIVRSRAELTGEHFTNAFPYNDPAAGNVIHLEMNSAGSKIWADTTSMHVRERFAIILDSEILLAPTIIEPITGGSSLLTGNFSYEEAQYLAHIIGNPLLYPCTIENISESPPAE